ncbi:MAG TPA: DNA-binding transcriptional regulator, partial [Atlantibacter hermannii]|nr:DNA-binding transcriptional regulator [Atlantibacter hermannii]
PLKREELRMLLGKIAGDVAEN